MILYPRIFYVCEQILAEMDRIAEKAVSKTAVKKWMETVPKLNQRTQVDHTIDILLEEVDDYTEGRHAPHGQSCFSILLSCACLLAIDLEKG